MNTWTFLTVWNFWSWFANGLERSILHAFHDLLSYEILHKAFLVFAIGLGFSLLLYFIFNRR